MSSDEFGELLDREAILAGGAPAKRANTVLFLIESRTAQLTAQSRQAMEGFPPQETAEEREVRVPRDLRAGQRTAAALDDPGPGTLRPAVGAPGAPQPEGAGRRRAPSGREVRVHPRDGAGHLGGVGPRRGGCAAGLPAPVGRAVPAPPALRGRAADRDPRKQADPARRPGFDPGGCFRQGGHLLDAGYRGPDRGAAPAHLPGRGRSGHVRDGSSRGGVAGPGRGRWRRHPAGVEPSSTARVVQGSRARRSGDRPPGGLVGERLRRRSRGGLAPARVRGAAGPGTGDHGGRSGNGERPEMGRCGSGT